jgi:transposase-like protein
MVDVERRCRFVELRGRGVSYNKISEELGVTTRTLMNWSKDLSNDISNRRTLEVEEINEKFLLGRQQQIKIAGAQLGQITEELLKRDLCDVPTPKLFDMQRKLVKEIGAESATVAFVEETPNTVNDRLHEINTKTDVWVG